MPDEVREQYGHIGRQVARLASAFGARVIVCTRSGQKSAIGGYHVPNSGDSEGEIPEKWYSTKDRGSLETFLGECDVLVDLLPSHEMNKGFIGREELKLMKVCLAFSFSEPSSALMLRG